VLMEERFETEMQQKNEEEQRQKTEQAVSDSQQNSPKKPLLSFSLTLPDVEEPMEPLYHHQFYYL